MAVFELLMKFTFSLIVGVGFSDSVGDEVSRFDKLEDPNGPFIEFSRQGCEKVMKFNFCAITVIYVGCVDFILSDF